LPPSREPRPDRLRLYRRAAGLLNGMQRLPSVGQRVAERDSQQLGDEPTFQAVYTRLAERGLPLRPFEGAWADPRRLRRAYVPHLLAATELLLVPREFRHHGLPVPAPEDGKTTP
jgi:hypothetical protein